MCFWKYNSVFVYHRNKQVLATEVHKFVNGFSPKLVSGCFKLDNMSAYKTRNSYTFYSRPVCTNLYGTESHFQLRPKICGIVSKNFQHSLPPKTPLSNGSHMLVHVGLVETTSIRLLVSFSFWMQNQLFFTVFFFYLPSTISMENYYF